MGNDFTRRGMMCGGMAVTLGAATSLTGARRALAADRLRFAGLNLAGAEFGKIPGRNGFDYAYPSIETIDYYAKLGFNVIRVPFRWERLQPQLRGPIADDEQARLAVVVRHAVAQGQSVILDPHNYARRRIADDGWKGDHAIGSDAVPIDAFADFWGRLAQLYRSSPRVIFGLMNEPAGISADAWLPAANAAVASIRDAGASNLILVPGVAYTGAHSWMTSGNVKMGEIVDPRNRFAFEVHQYFDHDSSGTKPLAESATIGSERIREFQKWARDHQFKAVLGEFGAADNAPSLAALRDLCRMLEANADVWLGWVAWAGGNWWPHDYMFNLGPAKDGGIREQTRILAEFAQRVRD